MVINHFFRYDKKLGKLFWKRVLFNKKQFIGKECKSSNTAGYIRVKLNNKIYLVHRLIWFIENGYYCDVLDHIDGVRSNNKISNLRKSNHSLNQCNTLKNRQGHLAGVTYNKQAKKWRARITVDKVRISLGLFKTRQAAGLAYSSALTEYGVSI